jgi:Na+-driven multidrug efflux pump
LRVPLDFHGGEIARISKAKEAFMKRLDLPAPAFFFIVGTRALLGAGVGLLVADKLGRRQRHRLGAVLVGVGALTTIPAAFALFGRGFSNPDPKVLAAS